MSRRSKQSANSRRSLTSILWLLILAFAATTGMAQTEPYRAFLEARDLSVVGIDQESRFGHAIAIGRFDGDDFLDLAVSASDFPSQGVVRAGAVFIFWGLESRKKHDPKFDLERPTILSKQDCNQGSEAIQEGERFGFALAAGDLDPDLATGTPGFDDLVVGIPYNDGQQDGAPVVDSGSVCVFFGNSNRSRLSDNSLFLRRNSSAGLLLQEHAAFGSSVVIGDLIDTDGRREIAVGAPLADSPNARDSGEVVIFDGSTMASGTLLLPGGCVSPDTEGAGIPTNHAEQIGSLFGYALAVGHYTTHTPLLQDLAVGAPMYDMPGGDRDVGVVYTFDDADPGSCRAIEITDLEEGRSERPYRTNNQPRMGYSLAFGDFNGDSPNGRDDLAIGIPRYSSRRTIDSNLPQVNQGGSVAVVYSDNFALDLQESAYEMDEISHWRILRQARARTPNNYHSNESLGQFIGVGDVNNDGIDDLLASVYEHNASPRMPNWAPRGPWANPYELGTRTKSGGFVVSLGTTNEGLLDSRDTYTHPDGRHSPDHSYVMSRIALYTELDLREQPQERSYGPTAFAVLPVETSDGTPIVIYGKPRWDRNDGLLAMFEPYGIPIIGSSWRDMADSVVVVDLDEGDVIAARNPFYLHSPHSMTKVMTGLLMHDAVVDERVRYEDLFVYVRDDFTYMWKLINLTGGKAPVHFTDSTTDLIAGGANNNAFEGEQISIQDHMARMLLPSDNSSWLNLGFLLGDDFDRPDTPSEQAWAWSKYVDIANARAEALGMVDTDYRLGFGLNSRGGTGTALDYSKLLVEVMSEDYEDYRAGFLAQASLQVNSWRTNNGTWKNANGVFYQSAYVPRRSGAFWCSTLLNQHGSESWCNHDPSDNVSVDYSGMVSLGGKTGTWNDSAGNPNANLMQGYLDTNTSCRVGVVIMGSGSNTSRHSQNAAIARWALDELGSCSP